MSKKLMSITVQGKNHDYSFNFYGEKKYLEEWRNEGLVIDEVLNTIPVFVVRLKLTRVWVKLQDVFNFKFWG